MKRMRMFGLVFLTGVLLSLPVNSVCARRAADGGGDGEIDKTVQAAADELLATEDCRKLLRLPAQWKKLPESSRRELVIVLLGKMESLQPLKLTDYADMAVKSRVAAKKMQWHGHGLFLDQDVFIVGGRCAWAIEEMLGCKLPPITEELKPEALSKSVKTAAHTVKSCFADELWSRTRFLCKD